MAAYGTTIAGRKFGFRAKRSSVSVVAFSRMVTVKFRNIK